MKRRELLASLGALGTIGIAGCTEESIGDMDNPFETDQSDDDQSDGGLFGESDSEPWEAAFELGESVDAVQTHRKHDSDLEYKSGSIAPSPEKGLTSDDIHIKYRSIFKTAEVPFEATAIMQSVTQGPDAAPSAWGDEVTSHVVNYRFGGDYFYAAEDTDVNPVVDDGDDDIFAPLVTSGHVAEEYTVMKNEGSDGSEDDRVLGDTYVRYSQKDSDRTAAKMAMEGFRNEYLFHKDPFDHMGTSTLTIRSPVLFIIESILTDDDKILAQPVEPREATLDFKGMTKNALGLEGEEMEHYYTDSPNLHTDTRTYEYLMIMHGITGGNAYDYDDHNIEIDIFLDTKEGRLAKLTYTIGDTNVGGVVIFDYKDEDGLQDVTEHSDWTETEDMAAPKWTQSDAELSTMGSMGGREKGEYYILQTDFGEEIDGGYVSNPIFPLSKSQSGEFDFTVEPGKNLQYATKYGEYSITKSDGILENDKPSIEQRFHNIGPIAVFNEDGTPVFWDVLH